MCPAGLCRTALSSGFGFRGERGKRQQLMTAVLRLVIRCSLANTVHEAFA